MNIGVLDDEKRVLDDIYVLLKDVFKDAKNIFCFQNTDELKSKFKEIINFLKYLVIFLFLIHILV